MTGVDTAIGIITHEIEDAERGPDWVLHIEAALTLLAYEAPQAARALGLLLDREVWRCEQEALPPTCSGCSGSGEGQYDGVPCAWCGGAGVDREELC